MGGLRGGGWVERFTAPPEMAERMIKAGKWVGGSESWGGDSQEFGLCPSDSF